MFPRLGGGHTGDNKQPGTYLCPALKSHLRERVFKSKNGSLKKPKNKNQAEGERGAKENSLPHKGLQSKDKTKSTANTLQAQRTRPREHKRTQSKNFHVFIFLVLSPSSYPIDPKV